MMNEEFENIAEQAIEDNGMTIDKLNYMQERIENIRNQISTLLEYAETPTEDHIGHALERSIENLWSAVKYIRERKREHALSKYHMVKEVAYAIVMADMELERKKKDEKPKPTD